MMSMVSNLLRDIHRLSAPFVSDIQTRFLCFAAVHDAVLLWHML
jgi:hypothetical protein